MGLFDAFWQKRKKTSEKRSLSRTEASENRGCTEELENENQSQVENAPKKVHKRKSYL